MVWNMVYKVSSQVSVEISYQGLSTINKWSDTYLITKSI